MEDSGLPTFIVVVALGVVGIAITVAMAVVTWVFLLTSP